MAREALEQRRLLRIDTEVPQLHLRLRPGKRRRAHVGIAVAVFVDEVEDTGTRCRGARPKRNPRSRAGGNAHSIAQREHRIEHRAHGI